MQRDEPLLVHLLAKLGSNRTAVKNLLKHGAVQVNGAAVRQFDHALVPGDEITVGNLQAAAATERLQSARIQIVHEDAALLVLDKPSGLLTVATEQNKTDTLFFRLNQFLSERDGPRAVRPQVVHRLDQETSGLVMFAKSAELKQLLQDRWTEVQKTYWAVVEGTPSPTEGTITNYLTESKALRVFSSRNSTPDAREATTHYRTEQTRDGLSLLEIRLETGRKHQIRVHMADLRTPVAGDVRYGAKSDPCRRLALHAGRLTFEHPQSGESLTLTSPLPQAFRKLFS